MGDSWASRDAPVNTQHADVFHRCRADPPSGPLSSAQQQLMLRIYAALRALACVAPSPDRLGGKSMLFGQWQPAFMELSVQRYCRGAAVRHTMGVWMVCLRLRPVGVDTAAKGAGARWRRWRILAETTWSVRVRGND